MVFSKNYQQTTFSAQRIPCSFFTSCILVSNSPRFYQLEMYISFVFIFISQKCTYPLSLYLSGSLVLLYVLDTCNSVFKLLFFCLHRGLDAPVCFAFFCQFSSKHSGITENLHNNSLSKHHLFAWKTAAQYILF